MLSVCVQTADYIPPQGAWVAGETDNFFHLSLDERENLGTLIPLGQSGERRKKGTKLMDPVELG